MNNIDRGWVLTCFGTAVGAGILFLPIQAGFCGVWPIIFLTAIIFPITYISHRGITRIVASCQKETDIVGAVEHDLGSTTGFVVSVLYFLSIITICVGYATGLTNLIGTFLVNQLQLSVIPRPLLTFIILSIMTSILLGNEKLMITITSIITFPLIILLFGVSLYMIPQWNMSAFHLKFILKDFIKNIFLLLPILIFSMNFSPVCSVLGVFYRKKYGNSQEAIKRSDNVVKWTSILLLFFVIFFVFSLFFSITPDVLKVAKTQNLDTLSAIAIVTENPLEKYFVYIFPTVAFLAIASSYFGHFTGTREGLSGVIIRIVTFLVKPSYKEKLNSNTIPIKLISTLLLFAFLWILAVYNPSILTIISALSAPIIAMYAYLMPIIMMKKVPRLRVYRSKLAALVFIMGILTMVGYVVGKMI
ncbi:MAG: amino acid permease [Endomicrobium sp.]|nr:amino acid permease [Endomicrobium sp.]